MLSHPRTHSVDTHVIPAALSLLLDLTCDLLASMRVLDVDVATRASPFPFCAARHLKVSTAANLHGKIKFLKTQRSGIVHVRIYTQTHTHTQKHSDVILNV